MIRLFYCTHQCLHNIFERLFLYDRHQGLKPKQIHCITPSSQMLATISHTLTGSLIIFDCTLLPTLTVHISATYLVNGTHCWFPFSPCYQSWGHDCWHGNDWKTNRGLWQAWANNLSMIKATERKRTLCAMIGEGWEEGPVVKHITSVQSFSDTEARGMEKGVQLQSINGNYYTNTRQ